MKLAEHHILRLARNLGHYAFVRQGQDLGTEVAIGLDRVWDIVSANAGNLGYVAILTVAVREQGAEHFARSFFGRRCTAK
ncbi:hypothetical protein [Mesorhizobium silamurunense]|uniref:hypothetical protein n=1 Tax=Mesorhizobium silamurunense TaxID=499528 RepID=UPI0017804845|nr:hypothetical protein [Mesorhizobium silamurunense]